MAANFADTSESRMPTVFFPASDCIPDAYCNQTQSEDHSGFGPAFWTPLDQLRTCGTE